jgi:hypothetical protein
MGEYTMDLNFTRKRRKVMSKTSYAAAANPKRSTTQNAAANTPMNYKTNKT